MKFILVLFLLACVIAAAFGQGWAEEECLKAAERHSKNSPVCKQYTCKLYSFGWGIIENCDNNDYQY